jgi:hypothetical protein
MNSKQIVIGSVVGCAVALFVAHLTRPTPYQHANGAESRSAQAQLGAWQQPGMGHVAPPQSTGDDAVSRTALRIETRIPVIAGILLLVVLWKWATGRRNGEEKRNAPAASD